MSFSILNVDTTNNGFLEFQKPLWGVTGTSVRITNNTADEITFLGGSGAGTTVNTVYLAFSVSGYRYCQQTVCGREGLFAHQ